ncbi:MAG: type II toxin-antitoxin system RelE/ParE family toxin [Rhodoferax sp.]|nr:type II toxin-antitoxin system RelE/ParE family toxin [Rhodoferax sp.]
MQVKFATLAEVELDEATLYYENKVPGLGAQFRDQVEHSARQIGRMPLLYAEIRPAVRRYVLRRFPYSLVYSVEADYVLVIAVAHHKRRAQYWAGQSSS